MKMEAQAVLERSPSASNNSKKLKNYLKRYWTLYLLLFLPLTYFIVFRYWPMLYLQTALKDYKLNMSVWEMPWATNRAGEQDIWIHFRTAFGSTEFWRALINTLRLNLLDLALGFPAPIIMALLLNELVFSRFKRVTQTISYMPHFLSWIIIAALATQLLAPTNGLVNIWLRGIGLDTINFLNIPWNWVWSYVFIGIWQNLGWGSIIYLAAMTAINQELYEAAAVDGASRMRKIWHITLPGIRPTIITLLILAIGGIVASNFDRPFALRNPLIYEMSDVMSIYMYRIGLLDMKFSLSTAVGVFSSVINVVFLFSANAIAKRVGERGIW